MKLGIAIAAGIASFALATAAITRLAPQSQDQKPSETVTLAPTKFKLRPGVKAQRAVVAGGCFWGTEKYLRLTPGITATAVGYIGGKTKNPTYKEVCYENTGHAEAVMVEFDPSVISYKQVLDRFWNIHNPCTMNRQGPDVGTQYRSGIYPVNDEQRKIAEQSKKDAAPLFKRPIVTEIVMDQTFWMAEDYHQQYSEKTGRACHIDFSDHVNGGAGG
ncbi:MAG: peptide-methionine (S)-S-oxide reductase MsrA [Fimbriimonadaceae bacterium]|nr:peptide-methionine (S)-S-oxide reductase MsrA [Fimbriimonadaceae bacterium]